jgi:predicted secreted acid phosphatase
MPPKVIPTRQAATEKQCSVPAILAAIKRGAIDGQQMGREYVVFPNKKYHNWEPDRLRQQIGRESQRGPSVNKRSS